MYDASKCAYDSRPSKIRAQGRGSVEVVAEKQVIRKRQFRTTVALIVNVSFQSSYSRRYRLFSLIRDRRENIYSAAEIGIS